jgi:uncharacterized protein (TIGR02266 family)
MAGTTVPAKTVVVAADAAFVRDRFQTVLEAAGHDAIAVERATDLVDLITADPRRIDLVVLDLQLPDSSGVDLVRTIRTLDQGQLALLVFSGTIANAQQVRELSALGVAGYVNEYIRAQHILPALAPHLFPDSFNRRSSPRVVLGIPLEYRFANTNAAALTLNLSHGGLGIRTTSPLEAGSRIQVKFRMPGTLRDVETPGAVVWSDERVGMGVQFDAMDPAAQAAIGRFVDRQLFQHRKV